MRKILLPLLFGCLFIAESLYVQFIPNDPFGGRILAPHFLFSALLFLTIFVGKKQGIIYAAVFGLIFDIVYVEVIGVYFFLFPFISYLISKMMQVLWANMVVSILAVVLGIALLELGVYELNYLIHVTDLDFMSFFHLRFYPTLLFNVCFVIVVSYPLKRWFEKYAEALLAD